MEVHMEKDKKVTALYCRLSKDDGSNSESLSIRTQKAMLMEYATRNGFGNCQYYVDDGYSGTNSDRPAFQELLDDIRDGKVATVITDFLHASYNKKTIVVNDYCAIIGLNQKDLENQGILA